MFWGVAITAAMLGASRACAAEIMALATDDMIEIRASDVLERRYEDVANRYIQKRQTPAAPVNPQSEVTLNPDGTLNMTAWEEETSVACTKALSHLDIASNPSGTCICYNLPLLDVTTGVFQADLRVFKVSEPNGAFAGIPPQNIQVGLMYVGASVSPVSASRIAGVDSRALTEVDKRAVEPVLLQSYLFVGQIDQARMVAPMSMSQLEALVMPILTLTGINSTGQTISTNVSSNEAAFVTGVFSKEVIRSDFAIASQAVENVTISLLNGTTAFVLPGVQIMVFPVGLVVTSVWLLLGFIAYGYGTYERIMYAESYKRRKALAGSSASKRI